MCTHTLPLSTHAGAGQARYTPGIPVLIPNTVPDNHPLLHIDEILRDCAKGKIFGKMDMTNSFFQTCVHPNDVHLMANLPPFGLYEWTVMPMGVQNAPAFHQHCMTAALRHLIGKCCHVYLDDIIIWSQTIKQHETNVRQVLDALCAVTLFCSLKKTSLFLWEVDFLRRWISAQGVEPDPKKIEKIVQWPISRSMNETCSFLGLVRFLADHIPQVAEHTQILTPLTTKDAERHFPIWTDEHTRAFQALKDLVVSPHCLTTIDHNNPGNNKIFLTCNASDYRTGAILSWGKTWETACPVAFDSYQLHGAELNYPVHEKELLAIIKALKKWRIELLGAHVYVYTDHHTLENFPTQRDLSRCQACWQEYMSQFDLSIRYLQGDCNVVADALSRTDLPSDTPEEDPEETVTLINAINIAAPLATLPPDDNDSHPPPLHINLDRSLVLDILRGYTEDPYCRRLFSLLGSFPNLVEHNGLLYLSNKLVIPRINTLCEKIFHLAHDVLGHFAREKTYAMLWNAYYWPNMRRDLLQSYIPACSECLRNKSLTTTPAGPLHPLPIPNQRGDSVAMDFIGPLPADNGCNMIITFTDRLYADLRLVPCKDTISAKELTSFFFQHWYCENGLPLDHFRPRQTLHLQILARTPQTHRCQTQDVIGISPSNRQR